MIHTASGGATEADIRILLASVAGLAALSAVSAQSAQDESWRQRSFAVVFGLGDQKCGEGWHQALWLDWRGEWWWGPCVVNR